MSIFIIYLKILNCQPLFSTNLLIIVSTAPTLFEYLYIFALSLDFSHQIAYTITIVIISPVWERAMFCCCSDTSPPFFFFHKIPLPHSPYIIYIFMLYLLCNKHTHSHSLAPTRYSPHIRRTLWEGKLPGIGRARKMVGAYPRTPERTGKHARTRPKNAPNARRPSRKRPISGYKPQKSPHNFRKPPHRPKPRARMR